jgi:Zinc-binding dehydrogenase/ApeA N-terminal domain 1
MVVERHPGPMDYFTFEGMWWLPESPERRVPGTLTFDSDGLVLVVYDSIAEFTVPEGQVIEGNVPEWKLTPLIHGRRRDGKNVTLLRAEGANFDGPGPPGRFDVRQTYLIGMALVGAHIADDSFTEAWCYFDCLDIWAQPPSLTTYGDDGVVTVRGGQLELGSADVEATRIRLVSGVSGTSGGERVHLDRWSAFAVRVPAQPARDLVQHWVRPLQDLLTLAFGRSVRLTALNLVPAGTDAGGGSVEVTSVAIQAPPGPSPTWSSVLSYTAPTLLRSAGPATRAPASGASRPRRTAPRRSGCGCRWPTAPWSPHPRSPDADLIPSLLAASDVLGTGWFAAVAAEAGPGKTVVVVGDGAVGLLGILAAKQLAAERIIAMSRHEPRQKLAREYGATDIVEERGDEGVARIKELTNGLGAHSVIEAVGTHESMMQAIRSIRAGGHVGYVGVAHGVELPGEELFFSHVHLHGGPAPVPRFLPHLVDLIWNRQIDPGRVFDLELPLEQAAEGYQAMDERRAIKVLLHP